MFQRPKKAAVKSMIASTEKAMLLPIRLKKTIFPKITRPTNWIIDFSFY